MYQSRQNYGYTARFILNSSNSRYNYEKGAYALIPFEYDEAAATLTIGERQGEFPGMLKERTFNVVVVSKDKPQPFDLNAKGQVVKYDGSKPIINL